MMYVETTIRQLKEFINTVEEKDLDSPVFIENESGERFSLLDYNVVINKKVDVTKMILEFDREKTAE